jgi:hypothetical protein
VVPRNEKELSFKLQVFKYKKIDIGILFFYTYNMREVLGPPMKNSICFYRKVANGLSGWLNQEDVNYLMDYILTYDTVSVEECPSLYREGIEWYGLHLKAAKEIKMKKLLYLDGRKRMVPVSEFKDADTVYHFKEKNVRDSVLIHIDSKLISE